MQDTHGGSVDKQEQGTGHPVDATFRVSGDFSVNRGGRDGGNGLRHPSMPAKHLIGVEIQIRRAVEISSQTLLTSTLCRVHLDP
jgi:hypothetical protein